MSENTTTPTVFKVKITNVADFRAVAPLFDVAVSDGPGAMPKRQLLVKVREAVKAGKAELIETDYFGVDAILNPSNTTGNKGKSGDWKISYRVVDAETGKLGTDVQSVTVDKDKIKSVIPDASFQGAKLNAVIALVMVAHLEGAGIAELKNYVVTDVVRQDAVSATDVAETVPDVKEESVTPELVPAESAAKVATKRTRKPAAKAASK